MEFEKKVCPDCNGSGVCQEYDEYDRYTVHSCATCDGLGEIARQSVKSEEVAETIEHLKNENGFTNGKLYRAVDLAITALQACQTKEPCDYCKSGIDTVSLMDSNMLMRFVSPVNYCPNCGQKIDWRED